MFQDFNENNNNDDDFLNEFRQKLANQANARNEEKQKDLQRSKSVFLGAIAGVGLACVVGWFALSPKQTGNEEVPIIKKQQAAVKIKPTEPGGMEILNQDKTVYNIIDKSNEANVEQLLPPPEEPKLPEISPETAEEIQPVTIAEIIDNVDGGEIVVADVVEPQGIEDAPEAKTLPFAEAVKASEPVVEEPAAAERERDYLLPEVKKEAPKEVKPEPAKEEAVVDNAKPATAPSGTWQIQIMSSKNKKAVEDSIKPTVKKHSVLANLPYEIEEADLQFDGIFYRLKFGAFSAKNDADIVCGQIKANGGSCLVKKK
ncbi:MAG: SPOR domain-containing protein [Lactobacillaceae bacterium]|jgi:hypothetical protein|nr:SPOR domain-containing protein [Lactobacillaceae bacterium]